MTRDGLLIVDKPAGATSADVVRIVKRALGCKTGHLGTLDPFATGVLPLCLGEGTKLAPFLNEDDKEYEGIIRLGRAMDSGDVTGSVTEEAPVPELDALAVESVALRFRGESMQTPPMHSAIKRQGVPLYKLARKGIEVERAARAIRITALDLRICDPTGLQFRIACSKGTYIRVLAADMARALGTVGHVETLRRTRFGSFGLSSAVALDTIVPGNVAVIGLRDALAGMCEMELDATAAERARGGYEPVLRALDSGKPGEHGKLVGPDGDLIAVVVADAGGHWHFVRVFATRAVPYGSIH